MAAHGSNSPIIDAFEYLYAEPEEEWLHRAFVEPSEYGRIASTRSMLVLGPHGSGKSALCHFLLRSMKAPSDKRLAVLFQPRQPAEHQSQHENARNYLTQIVDLTLRELLIYIGTNPDAFSQLPSWLHDTLYWLLQSHMQGHPVAVADRLQDQLQDDGAKLVRKILEKAPKYSLYKNPSETEIVREIAEVRKYLGLDSIWLFVDGFERWLDIDQTLLAEALQALLSILSLFEIPGFAIKLLAPSEIESTLMTSSGILRRRLDVARLSWTDDALIKIVEKRLALLTGMSTCSLRKVAEDDRLVELLREYGGDTPRGWLDVGRPFIDYYIRKNHQQLLNGSQFEEIIKQNPPRLRIDGQFDEVYLGYKKLERVPPGPFRVLQYMLKNHHRFCGRSELYYCALNDNPKEPQQGDQEYVDPGSWKSGFDNVIYHLRKSIEPDPRNPTYILSERGKGLRVKYVL